MNESSQESASDERLQEHKKLQLTIEKRLMVLLENMVSRSLAQSSSPSTP